MANAWWHEVPPCDHRPLGARQLERIVLRRALHGPVRFRFLARLHFRARPSEKSVRSPYTDTYIATRGSVGPSDSRSIIRIT
jgi:hypothetical protein